MTGISIRLELRDGEARRQLQALLERLDAKRPFYAAVGERLLLSTARNFDRETSPDGRPWQALAPKTVKARQRAGQTPITILRSNTRGRSGSSLAGSVNYQASEEELLIGSPKETAAIHQLGGTIQKQARQAKIYRQQGKDGMIGRRFAKKKVANHITTATIPAHTITIPARPYIGPSPEDEIGILEDAEDWLTR